MRFIHISDIHLNALSDASMPWAKKRQKDRLETFEEIIKTCNKKRVDLLLIAGDLFDSQPLFRDVKMVNDLFATLSRTEVVLIVGDHDYLSAHSYMTDFTWNENVHLLKSRLPETIYFSHLDTEVCGFSYHSPKQTDALLDQLKVTPSDTYRILLAHGGDAIHLPISYKKVADAGFNYVALGHMHTPRLFEKENMAYAGSLEPLCEEETGDHGFILGEITDEGTTISLIPIAKCNYQSITLSLDAQTTPQKACEKLKEMIHEAGEDNIYSVTLTGHYHLENPFHEEDFYECGNILRIINKLSPDFDILTLAVEHKEDIIGQYMESLHKLPKSPLNNKALNYGLTALLKE